MQTTIALSPLGILRERLANTLRKRTFIITVIRFATALKYLGPWRNFVIRVNALLFSKTRVGANSVSLFPCVEVPSVLKEVREKGFCKGLELPGDLLQQLLECYSKEDYHHNCHDTCEAMNCLVHDPVLIDIARRYLGSEPRVYLSRIYESNPEGEIEGLRPFHYDVGDYKSINAFFYLCDVGIENCPHCYIEGSHKITGSKKLVYRFLRHRRAEERFEGRIRLFTGNVGDGFMEDVTGYHKRSRGTKKRLALSITYTAMRRPQPIL